MNNNIMEFLDELEQENNHLTQRYKNVVYEVRTCKVIDGVLYCNKPKMKKCDLDYFISNLQYEFYEFLNNLIFKYNANEDDFDLDNYSILNIDLDEVWHEYCKM
jgi:hypothetical protein